MAKTGVIVDVETTGLSSEKDEIIEIGLIEFKWEPKPVITYMYGGLQEVGMPLESKVSRLTGISDEDLEGQSIDWDIVRKKMSAAEVIIAHNAEFDKSFLMQREELAGIETRWACSHRHIDWKGHGYKSGALNYLACDHGFLNPFAHRAMFDCATTFRLITPYLEELLLSSQMREYMVKAVGSPFATKDLLKDRGYRWDPAERVWSRRVLENHMDEERAFLAENVYSGESCHQESLL